MEALIEVAKALSDENRVRILLSLRSGELCVCQVTELLALAPSTVSKHISILRRAGFVKLRKEGRWVYYRLAGRETPAVARSALAWVFRHAGTLPRARSDLRRLRQILRLDRSELCRTGAGP